MRHALYQLSETGLEVIFGLKKEEENVNDKKTIFIGYPRTECSVRDTLTLRVSESLRSSPRIYYM